MIVDSLKMAFFMLWETLWALIVGFTLSGAVQAFVSRAQMERALGDHRPAAVARASALGMVSSSCSYAAAAMAKSLFQKGADFVSAMVFMFASTNLVIELGVVLAILLGWQFAAAEFVGGPIMIVLLALAGGYVLNRRVTEPARERLRTGAAGAGEHHHHVEGGATRATWADAATYTVADITMLRRELVIGYLVAGVLAAAVPTTAWNDLFLTGHGFWTALENALLGPVIAFVSFVCSIGNVPLAAALWHGGIGFGGVVSFIFADLITLPLFLIYRKYYGTRLAVRLVVFFGAVMAAAGLAVHGLFAVAGWIPGRPHGEVAPAHLAWNYTTFLNIVALAAFALLYGLYRTRDRSGGSGFAIDPVCGMQVRTADAPATAVHDGARYWYCSDRCHDRHRRDRVTLPTPPETGAS